jgi:energy-coupling factor transporter transmembrane protein EcfT
MPRIVRRPGLVLAIGFAAVLAAAIAPAGLNHGPIPAASWGIWVSVLAFSLATFRGSGIPARQALRRLVWLLPLIALLTLPAALLAAPGGRLAVGFGLAARALAATGAGAALAAWLGPQGFLEATRQLKVPDRLVHVLAAALGSLVVVAHQVRAMLRAREARRPGYGPWASILASPRQTARGFGRLSAALLLRSLERAEALDRARRARGIGEP